MEGVCEVECMGHSTALFLFYYSSFHGMMRANPAVVGGG